MLPVSSDSRDFCNLGKQLVIEMYDCRAEKFDDVEWVKGVFIEAAKRARATIVEVVFHKFNPFGISGVVVISESHFAVHTWSEHRYAALDIFTCGDILDGDAAISYIAGQLQSARHSVTELRRGLVGSEAVRAHTALPPEDVSEKLVFFSPSPAITPFERLIWRGIADNN